MKCSMIVTLSVLFALLSGLAQAENGTCRYDEQACSCKYGESNAGVCWDMIQGPSWRATCQSRYCNPGWTCSCSDRTHVCAMMNVSAMIIDSVIPGTDTAKCHEKTVMVAGAGEAELGGWWGSFSREGLLHNACTELRWWLNGEEMSDFDKTPIITANNVDEELERRADHGLIDFRSGDLLAFRFKNASYHCQQSHYTIKVNGNILEFDNSGATDAVRFARQHTDGWYLPSFTPSYGASEDTSAAWEFVPLRTHFYSDSSAILPGVDYWQWPDSSRDHELSNFYFRIQL